MKYQVGQYLLSLYSFGYNPNTNKYDFPIIVQIAEIKPYVIIANSVRNGSLVEIRKTSLKKNFKLLTPVEMELY